MAENLKHTLSLPKDDENVSDFDKERFNLIIRQIVKDDPNDFFNRGKSKIETDKKFLNDFSNTDISVRKIIKRQIKDNRNKLKKKKDESEKQLGHADETSKSQSDIVVANKDYENIVTSIMMTTNKLPK